LFVEPSGHALGLTLASGRQRPLHVGFTFMQFVGFSVAPKNQIHDGESLIGKFRMIVARQYDSFV
jgi:hypothetical protein